jgi:hypothetical protein
MYGEDLDPGGGRPPMDHYQMRVLRGTPVDGAVVELSPDGYGILAAEVRIPAPEAP